MGKMLKVFKNKKNNQLMVLLSRKKLKLKGKDPISIEIKKINFLTKRRKR